MPIQIQGSTGTLYPDTLLDADGEVFDALLILEDPMQAAGQYRLSVATQTLAAGLPTGAVVFAARWANPTGLAVIEGFEATFLPFAIMTGTPTDATSFSAYIARNYVGPHFGGSGSVLTANKMRASMSGSQFADIRIAQTVGLVSGVFTPDPHAFAASIRTADRVNRTGTEEIIQPFTDDIGVYFSAGDGVHPIILSQNEGILLVNRTLWQAAGTGKLVVRLVWAEVAAY